MNLRPILCLFVALTLAPALPAVPCALSHASAQPSAQSASADEGRILRSFVHDLVAASSLGDAPSPERLREAVAGNPEVLKWMVEGRDFEPLLEAADLKGALGGRLQLPKELIPADMAPLVTQKLSQSTRESRLRALQQIPDHHFIQYGQKIRSQVDQLDLGKTGAVRMLANPRTELGITDLTLAGLMEKVIPRYYSTIHRVDKTAIVLAQLKLKPNAQVPEQLGALLMDSGPCMQKLFQLVGKDVKRPEFAATMSALQNEIKPFSFDEFRSSIEGRTGRKLEELFKSIDPKPLAAASVGQVHRAELQDGTVVAVKVRRPGLEAKAEREIAGLLQAASQDPMALELLTRVSRTVTEEMDFRNEARNIELGLRYVRPERGISIAQRIDAFTPAEDMLVSRLAPGAKISKFDPSDLNQLRLRTQALEALLETWFDEVIFGDGFFHGDLHPGNVFFKEAPGTRLGYELTVIDFGNAGSLSVEERKAFVELVLAAQAPNPEKMLETLGRIGKIPDSRQPKILAEFRKIASSDLAADRRLDRALVVALENGLEIPGSFIAFNRGRAFLEKELQRLSSELIKIDPGSKYAAPSVQRIYRNLALKRVTRSILDTLSLGGLFSAEARAAQVVTPGMLLGALGDKLKVSAGRAGSACMDSFRSLFVDLVF